MFEILNGHPAPNPKELFETNNDSMCPYNLRNTPTDFTLPLTKKDFGMRCTTEYSSQKGINFRITGIFENNFEAKSLLNLAY